MTAAHSAVLYNAKRAGQKEKREKESAHLMAGVLSQCVHTADHQVAYIKYAIIFYQLHFIKLKKCPEITEEKN